MADCVNALKEWTGKTRATKIYDSTVDEFTNHCLFDKVKGKPNIAVVGFTTDGDVFGEFHSVAVTEQDKEFFDPSIFDFSFESHGRCMKTQRFLVKKLKKKALVQFCKNYSSGFVAFGVDNAGGFFLGNEDSDSYCWVVSDAFEGLEDTTLTGKSGRFLEGPYHHCARLVAIQLE